MACVRKRAVPWIDKDEFEQVYNEIFSSDWSQQQHALQRLSAWKCRLSDDNDLPYFVVCTSELVSVKLNNTNSDTSNDLNRQLSYAMSLVRFVNLMTSELERAETRDRFYSQMNSSQDQFTFAQFAVEDKRKTLKIIAKMLGIPEWQVDLRHTATHCKKLPSFTQFQQAVDFALDYLKETCWKPQLREKLLKDDLVCSSDTEPIASQILKDFMQTRFSEIMSVVGGNQKKRKSLTSNILLQMESLAKNRSENVISLLVEDGFMVFTSEQLTELGVNSQELVENISSLDLPEILVRFWQPILYLLNNIQVTPQLLDLLADELSEAGNLKDRIISGWISTILSAAYNHGKSSATEFGYLRPCSVVGRQLLQRVLQKPNQFTLTLVSKIFPACVPCLPEKSKQQIVDLLQCYVSRAVTEAGLVKSSEPVHDIGELRRHDSHMTESVVDFRNQSPLSFGCWTLATNECDWSLWPLGSYKGLNVGYKTVELPSTVNQLECQSDAETKLYVGDESMLCDMETENMEELAKENCRTVSEKMLVVSPKISFESCLRTFW